MSDQTLRILGLTTRGITHVQQASADKDGGLFAALNRRYSLVGMVDAHLPTVDNFINRVMHIAPDRKAWSARVSVNPWAFKRRSTLSERSLRSWDGQFDLIFQLHTLLAPGTRRRPYVLTTDNTYRISERYYPGWAILKGHQRDEWVRFEREVYHGAAFLFPWSEFARRSMIEDYGVPPERVIAVGAGMNLKLASLDTRSYASQTALFIGRDFERKGGNILLKAWERVHRRLPEARLLIVGPNPPTVASQAGVEWIGLVKSADRLAQLYQQASVFVLPSLFEPWGHVFLEAMGSGLPCIAANHCAMPEIVQDGQTGMLVPPREPEPLAEALIALLSDPARAEAMGRAGHAIALRGHSWDNVVARMAPYLEQATPSRGPATVSSSTAFR